METITNNSSFLIANNMENVFFHLKSVKNLKILGGCTIPEKYDCDVLTIRSIPELKIFYKHERYLDIGPAVTINELLSFGRTNIPSCLYDAASQIGNTSIRNLATVGGNILAPGIKHSLWAPLLALDAKLEFQNKDSSIIIPISRFKEIPEASLLTNIKIPIDNWDIEIYRRIGSSDSITSLTAGFVFLADTDRDIISNIKIAFSGQVNFRSRELENMIIGTKLPLTQKEIQEILQTSERLYETTCDSENSPGILKAQYQKLLHYSLKQMM